jgi:putative membrane protein
VGRRSYLDQGESAALEAQIAALEAQTGVQLVTAVIGKADDYPELPWKAFALGVSLAALVVVSAGAWAPQWNSAGDSLILALAILGAGATSAAVAVFVPAYARLFLRASRRDMEVHHYAQAFFLRRELFKTRERNGILLLVSRFERKVEILPDAGLHARVDGADWRQVIDAMTPLLGAGRCFGALQQGVARVQAMLLARGLTASGGNELPDRPVQETGAR